MAFMPMVRPALDELAAQTSGLNDAGVELDDAAALLDDLRATVQYIPNPDWSVDAVAEAIDGIDAQSSDVGQLLQMMAWDVSGSFNPSLGRAQSALSSYEMAQYSFASALQASRDAPGDPQLRQALYAATGQRDAAQSSTRQALSDFDSVLDSLAGRVGEVDAGLDAAVQAIPDLRAAVAASAAAAAAGAADAVDSLSDKLAAADGRIEALKAAAQAADSAVAEFLNGQVQGGGGAGSGVLWLAEGYEYEADELLDAAEADAAEAAAEAVLAEGPDACAC